MLSGAATGTASTNRAAPRLRSASKAALRVQPGAALQVKRGAPREFNPFARDHRRHIRLCQGSMGDYFLIDDRLIQAFSDSAKPQFGLPGHAKFAYQDKIKRGAQGLSDGDGDRQATARQGVNHGCGITTRR